MMLVENQMDGIELKLTNFLKDKFTDKVFYQFCQMNSELKFERDRKGNILIKTLKGGKTGIKNSEIVADLIFWNRKSKSGNVFDSSTGFRLPDKSIRSPDAA